MEHSIGGKIVLENAVLQRAHRHNGSRGASHDLLGLVADKFHGIIADIHRDYARFPQNDTLAFHINKGIGRTQINADISCHSRPLSFICVVGAVLALYCYYRRYPARPQEKECKFFMDETRFFRG